jgi:hypothetical protein
MARRFFMGAVLVPAMVTGLTVIKPGHGGRVNCHMGTGR